MRFLFNFQRFAGNPNTNTTDANTVGVNDLSFTMKEYYKTGLLQNVRTQDYFMQFAKKQSLPKNNGKKVEWRKFDTFANATTPLTEGVTPDGNKLNMTHVEASILQYGDYTTVSDRLELEAVDPIIAAATEEHGAQAGETLNVLTRDVVLTGTSVMYANGKTSRSALTADDKITGADVNKMVTFLKKMKAPKFEDGKYHAIIHPSVAEDLRQDSAWIDAHKYASPEEIFNGEIGELHGMRFVEDVNAKVYKTGDEGIATYATMAFGKDAYGVVEPDAESLEVIVKQRGSAGTSDPLDQRSTVGWKASTAAVILYEERMLRFESGSSYSAIDEGN